MSGISNFARGGTLVDMLIAGGAVFDPLSMLAMASTVAGTAISAAGSIAAGQNAQQMGLFQQQEYTQQAESDVATSQRKMLDQQRQEKMVQSQLVARASGGGLNAVGGSVTGLSSQIAGRGTYNSLMDLSQGENAAAGLTNMGSGARYGGDLAASMAPYAALGSIAGGSSSMFMAAAKNPAAFSLAGADSGGGSYG